MRKTIKRCSCGGKGCSRCKHKCFPSCCDDRPCGSSMCPRRGKGKGKSVWAASTPTRVSNLSRLIPDLTLYHNPDGTPIDPTTYNEDGTFFTWYRNVEGESWIAVNRKDPQNIAVLTQSDRFRGFLANTVHYTRDGGCSWNQGNLVTTRFAGPGIVQTEHGSAPMIASDGKGNFHALSLNFNIIQNFDELISIFKSTDGGSAWDHPVIPVSDDGFSHFLKAPDVESDRFRDCTLYLTWCDALSLLGEPNSLTYFHRSDDEGATWSQPVLFETLPNPLNGVDVYNWHRRVEALPNGTLVILAYPLLINFADFGTVLPLYVYRSTDGGQMWQQILLANVTTCCAVDPVDTIPVHDSGFDLAVDRTTGDVYAVWMDSRFNPLGGAGVVLAKSSDGGVTWSEPVPANPNTLGVQTFLPSVAVADDGTVAVEFYDFRFFEDNDPSLATDVWASLFAPDLKFISETRLTPVSFDTRQAMRRSIFDDAPQNLYLGDYHKITDIGNDFVTAFAVTNPPYGVGVTPENPGAFVYDPRNRQDIVFSRLQKKKGGAGCSPCSKCNCNSNECACSTEPAEPLTTNLLAAPPETSLEGTYYLCCDPVSEPEALAVARTANGPQEKDRMSARRKKG